MGIVEEFVLREGTDYGHREYELQSKVAAVMRQLESGSAELTFDPTTETTSVVDIER